MSQKRQIYEIMIREHHLDSYGHMNNATYLQIFEEARWEIITGNGYGYEKIHKKQVGPTILEVHLRFVKEVRLRQRMRIETYVTSYKRKIGTLVQEMKNGSGEICCVATFTFGLFDMAARKLITPTPEWLRALGLEENEFLSPQ